MEGCVLFVLNLWHSLTLTLSAAGGHRAARPELVPVVGNTYRTWSTVSVFTGEI